MQIKETGVGKKSTRLMKNSWKHLKQKNAVEIKTYCSFQNPVILRKPSDQK